MARDVRCRSVSDGSRTMGTVRQRYVLLGSVAVAAVAAIAILASQPEGGGPIGAPSTRAAHDTKASPTSDRAGTSASRRGRTAAHGAAAVDSWWRAPAGSEFTYDYALRTTYRMIAASPEVGVSGPPGAASLDYRGKLVVTVLDRDATHVLTRMAMPEFDFVRPAGGNGDSEDERQVARQIASRTEAARAGALVRMTHEGRFDGYRFEAELGGEQRNFVRTLLSAVQFSVPFQVPASWTREEADATGVFEAGYSRTLRDSERLRVMRRKHRYTEMATPDGSLPEHRAQGHAVGEFDPALGWLRSARLRESVAMELPMMQSNLEFAVDGTVELVASAIHRGATGVRLSEFESKAWASAAGHQEALGPSEAQRLGDLRDALGELDFAGALAALTEALAEHGLDSKATFEAWSQLGRLIEVDPAVAAQIQAELMAGRVVDEELAGMLVTALGSAGNEAAQTALLALWSADAMPTALREAVAASLHQLDQPSAALMNALTARLQSTRQMDAFGAANLLALGTLAPRSTDRLTGGATATAAMLAFEERARQLGATGVWLEALGNAADPAILPKLEPYFRDPSARLRATAIDSLRHLPEAHALSHALRAAGDGDARVRLASIESLRRADSPKAQRTLRELALGDPDTNVRRAAILGMGQRLRIDPSSRAALQRVADQDAVADLRGLAQRILADRRRG